MFVLHETNLWLRIGEFALACVAKEVWKSFSALKISLKKLFYWDVQLDDRQRLCTDEFMSWPLERSWQTSQIALMASDTLTNDAAKHN